MDSLIGLDIGHYRIRELIGKGGMAYVYRAYDTRLKRYDAFKIIRKDALPPNAYDRIRHRFEIEAKILGTLDHPNILKIFDSGAYGGLPFLVMELLEGGSLKDRIGQPIPCETVVSILIPIADSLVYAHEHQILHRDVKPANILFRSDGTPVLTDFGIAKIIEDNSYDKTLTGTGFGVGTPEYMSPEQSMTGKVDGRSDEYSLGIIFYEMLTGHKPFTGESAMNVMMKQQTAHFPDPRKDVPDLSDAVLEILNTALAKKPAKRYQTMAEFETALKNLLPAGTIPTASVLPRISIPKGTESVWEEEATQDVLNPVQLAVTPVMIVPAEKDDPRLLSGEELKADITAQVRNQLTTEITQQFEGTLTRQAKENLEKKLTVQLTEKITAQLKDQLTEEITQQKTRELQEKLTAQLKEQLTGQLREQLTSQIKEELQNQVPENLSSDKFQNENEASNEVNSVKPEIKNSPKSNSRHIKILVSILLGLFLLSGAYYFFSKKQIIPPGGNQSADYVFSAVPTVAPVTIPENLYAGMNLFFGRYEQDDNRDNGPEPIEWSILNLNNGSALLVSRYGLDHQAYSDTAQAVNWADSSIRAWLNGRFYQNSFSDEEKSRIIDADFISSEAPKWGDRQGTDAQDHVFLLSQAEVQEFFDNEESRRLQDTPYVYTRSSDSSNTDPAYSWWWLRSPGTLSFVAFVTEKGAFTQDYSVIHKISIRPAIQIRIK